jgi:plastocyanin
MQAKNIIKKMIKKIIKRVKKINKKILFGIIGFLVVAAVVAVIVLVANRGGNSPFQFSGKKEPVVPPTEVHVKSFGFQPDAMLLKAGTTVMWINEDSASHQVKFAAFTSAEIPPGKKFSYTFENRGIFDYFCALHLDEKARIVIE